MIDEISVGKSGADIFVETLISLGVEHLFLNPGFDLVPIMGAIARLEETGEVCPQIIMIPHEAAAVAAAHGYAMVAGKPQVVALFEDVGTLQGGGALINLQYGRIPVILCTGRNASPLHLCNWQGEPFDQGKIVRDYVKWDHSISYGEDIKTILQEAFRIANSGSKGPVYLTLAREALLGARGKKQVDTPRVSSTMAPDINDLRLVAEMLLHAQNPLIMTSYVGRNPQTVADLIALAELLAIRVIPTDLRMNFPSSHPLCPGIDASVGTDNDHYIEEADVVVLLDYNFPGPASKQVCPDADAKLIQIDQEPLKKGKHLWDRVPDIIIEGDSAKILPVLTEIVQQRMKDHCVDVHERFKCIELEHEKINKAWLDLAAANALVTPISNEWLCFCINNILADDSILIHMIPSNANGIAHQFQRVKPATLFSWGDNAGSMGWPLGAALGAKLAAPDKMVVSLIGDGGFMYGEPIATLWGAKTYKAPFLTVIFNNQSYASIKGLLRHFHGEESVSGDMRYKTGVDFKSPPDYATIATACDAYGQTVADPTELPVALEHALEQVRQGRSAILNVILESHL